MRIQGSLVTAICAALSFACGGDSYVGDPISADPAFVRLEPPSLTVVTRAANGTELHRFPAVLAGANPAVSSLRCSRAAGRVAYGNVGITSGMGVWTHRFDGSDVREITVPGTVVRAAGWSPDGTRLVIETGIWGSGFLAMVNADGTGLTTLLSGTATYLGPSWSPDGREILFSAVGPLATYPVRVIDVATRVTRTIAANGYQPRWSPDGQWIAFYEREQQPRALLLVDRNGGSLRTLVAADEHPTAFTWTDDGRVLYFEGASRYVISTVSGVRVSPPPEGWNPHAHWCATP